MDLNIESEVLDKGFDTAIRMLPIPTIAEEGIIVVKNVLKNDELREKIGEKIEGLLNKNGNIFNSISKIKNATEKNGLLAGVSKAGDILLSNAKSEKLIDRNTVNMVKGGKELMLDIVSKNKNEFAGQDEILNELSKNIEKLEQAKGKDNFSEIKKIEKEIDKQYVKLDKTVEILNKIEKLQEVKLSKGLGEISQLEKEIIKKVA